MMSAMSSRRKMMNAVVQKVQKVQTNYRIDAHYDKERKPEPTPDPALKGVKGKNCNRTACQKPGAVWYNIGTRAYYCQTCAELINRMNEMELCTLEEPQGEPERILI